jgi:hypothetical protein
LPAPKRSLVGQRSDQHNHLPTFHLRKVLNAADILGVLRDPLKQFAAQVLVRHFAPAEPQGDLHLVAILEKFEHVAHLDVVVAGIRIGPELDLFDLDDLLLLARFALAFLLFVFELAKIHDLANRRIGVRRNLNQIETGFVGHFHGSGRGHHTDVFAVGADQADFSGTDFFVDARAGVALRGRIMGSASDGNRPSFVQEYQGGKLEPRRGFFKAQNQLRSGLVEIRLEPLHVAAHLTHNGSDRAALRGQGPGSKRIAE